MKRVLVGYGPSIDGAFRRDTGEPALITQNGYSENAGSIKEHIEDIIAMDPTERSPVSFLVATNRSTTAEELYRTLKPLKEKGVRFLTPTDALALMPRIKGVARSAVKVTAQPGMYLSVGSLKTFGSPILRAPTRAEIHTPLPGFVIVKIDRLTELASAEIAELDVTITIDTNAIAGDSLNERVLPVVEGYELSEEFAESAWMKLEASRINVPLTGTVGDADVSAEGAQGTAGSMMTAGSAKSSIQIILDSFEADSKTKGPLIQAHAKIAVSGTGEAFAVSPQSVTMEFALTVGIGKETRPLVGGVEERMAGAGAGALFQSGARET